MTYHHLTVFERNQFEALLQAGKSIPAIASQLGRPKCTFYRERIRNSTTALYFARTAQLLADERRSQAAQDLDVDDDLWSQVTKCLKHRMSPEQISGRLEVEGTDSLSFSSIYKMVKVDKNSGGDLWTYLRRSGKTYRRKYGASGTTTNGIKNRISIEERPAIVDAKQRTGDIEGDTIIGANHKGVILTLNDRVTQKVVIEKLDSKESAHVCNVMIDAVKKFEGPIYSFTVDNGKEFAAHETFTKATGAPVFFCHTMSPQERGANENMNGLIRQYIPKGTDLTQVTNEQIRFIEYSLNSRPRKTLKYLTPLEVESKGTLKMNFFD